MNLAAPRMGIGRLALLLVALPVGMATLAFFVMPSLYSLWCKATGTGVSPNNPQATLAPTATGRFVEVFFESKVFDTLPVEFTCDQPSVTVEVGREGWNTYHLRNTSDRTVYIRPIHLVSPYSATPHFRMRICFCFNDQVLQPHETKDFPVAFNFDADLDARTTTASVCYSLFAIAPGAARSEEQLRIQRQIEGAGGVVTPGFRAMSEAEIQALREQEQRAKAAGKSP